MGRAFGGEGPRDVGEGELSVPEFEWDMKGELFGVWPPSSLFSASLPTEDECVVVRVMVRTS